jgi:hypothetical protein
VTAEQPPEALGVAGVDPHPKAILRRDVDHGDVTGVVHPGAKVVGIRLDESVIERPSRRYANRGSWDGSDLVAGIYGRERAKRFGPMQPC